MKISKLGAGEDPLRHHLHHLPGVSQEPETRKPVNLGHRGLRWVSVLGAPLGLLFQENQKEKKRSSLFFGGPPTLKTDHGK